MKLSTHPYPLFPPQISSEPSSDTRLIFVVPWRGPGSPEAFNTWLQPFTQSVQSFEMIVLIYSFEEDEDPISDSNLDFYWYLESAREEWLKKGLNVQPVHVTGIEQRWKNTDIAAFTGMREAAQRLLDNGRANGIVGLLHPGARYSDGYPDRLLEFYDQNPDSGLSECLWQCELPREKSKQESLPANEVREAELRAKLVNLRLRKAGYTLPVFALPSTLSLRAWVFRQISGKIDSATALAEQMMHLAGLEGTQVSRFRKGVLTLHPDQWAELSGNAPILPGADSFRQIQEFLLRSDNFFRARSSHDYQEVLATLELPVRAFLQAEQFFPYWQESLLNAHNLVHFRQLFSAWLSPLRMKRLLQIGGSYEQEERSLIKESAAFLHESYSIRSGILNVRQLLEYMRKAERGMHRVESRKWA